MGLILEVTLVVLTVEQKMFKKFLEQLNCEHAMVQICVLAEGLFEIPDQKERISRIYLSRELQYWL